MGRQGNNPGGRPGAGHPGGEPHRLPHPGRPAPPPPPPPPHRPRKHPAWGCLSQSLCQKAGDCIGCGHCDRRCPFHVKQRERIKTICEEFGK